MMKNKPLLPIAILLIVGATLFANPFTQNNYVGTWNNTIVYKDVTIDSVLIIKNNKDISYVRTYSDGSGTYTREGTWKKEDDHIKIIFNKDNSPLTNYNNTNYILLWKKHDNNLSIYVRFLLRTKRT